MSITDELRAYACNFYLFCYKDVREKLDAIANRIDAEHEHEMEERADRYSESRAKMNNCYIELPKDADGVPIRIGDVMEGTCPSGKHVNGTVNAIGDGVFWLSNVQFSLKPDYMHHHHAPTVEDVLTEFGIDWEHESDCEDRAALLREYAAKLRLAGDAAGPNELAMAYHVGYDDALAKRKPNANKVMQR